MAKSRAGARPDTAAPPYPAEPPQAAVPPQAAAPPDVAALLAQPGLAETLRQLLALAPPPANGQDALLSENSIVPDDVVRTKRRRHMRITGPIKHGRKWRLRIRDNTGKQTVVSFDTIEQAEAEAKRLKKEAEKVNGVSVAEAVELYRGFLTNKGNKPRSIDTTIERIRMFFGDVDRPLGAITTTDARKLVDRLNTRIGRTHKPLATDTKMNVLNQVRTFVQWARPHGYLKVDPFTSAKILGRRKKGKAQLTIDEAKIWLATALQLGGGGDVGAAASTLTLLSGLRASEISGLTCRDLDDGGRILGCAGCTHPSSE